MGPFSGVIALVLLLGLLGRRGSRGTYAAIGLATGLASLWVYTH